MKFLFLPFIALIFTVVMWLGYASRNAHASREIIPGIRDASIELNRSMQLACTEAQVSCELLNVGQSEGDGTGDPLSQGIDKVHRNIDALRQSKEGECGPKTYL